MARTKQMAMAKAKAKKKQKAKVIGYAKMVAEAIVSLKNPRGSSLDAIKKYIAAKWQVPREVLFAGHLRRCLARELGKGTLKKCKQAYKLASVKVAHKRRPKPKLKLKLPPRISAKCGVCGGSIPVTNLGGVFECPTCGWRSDVIPIEVILCTGERRKAVLREATHPAARGFPRGCIFIFKGHHEAHLGDDKFTYSDVVGSDEAEFVRVEGEARLYEHRCPHCRWDKVPGFCSEIGVDAWTVREGRAMAKVAIHMW